MSTDAKRDLPAAISASRASGSGVIESPARRAPDGPLGRVTNGARSLAPYANYAAQRLGAFGVVGVALVAFSAVAMLSANGPLREQLASDNAALARTTLAPDATAQTSASPQGQMHAFLRQLPTRDQLPGLMSQIVAVSATKGVELEQGKYELVATAKNGALARYRMVFPVVGNYPQVRGFIDASLAAVPAMSLDGLRLQRRNVGDGVVTADIDFAVFVRTTP